MLYEEVLGLGGGGRGRVGGEGAAVPGGAGTGTGTPGSHRQFGLTGRRPRSASPRCRPPTPTKAKVTRSDWGLCQQEVVCMEDEELVRRT